MKIQEYLVLTNCLNSSLVSILPCFLCHLQSINKGECPRELEPADQNTAIHVNLVKKDEEWKVSLLLAFCLCFIGKDKS